MNRNGFTFLMAVFIIMIVGILSAFTGKSWTAIMKREREKELIFRGSQIKEAIENWYNLNPKFSVPGVPVRTKVPPPLNDLKDLLQDPNSLTPIQYLPQNYAAALDDKNPRCAPDCAKFKVYQDPMSGKEWTIIRGTIGNGIVTPNQNGGIIGVASKSDDAPLKTDFSGTALENMGSIGTMAPVVGRPPMGSTSGTTTSPPGTGGKMSKYSDWKFVADPQNDHTKLYRAYHEGW